MKWLIAILVLIWVFDAAPSEKYRAEVGYHVASSEQWWFGRDTNRAACTAEAIWKYNSLNDETDGRAFSWACLRIGADGNILGRVR